MARPVQGGRRTSMGPWAAPLVSLLLVVGLLVCGPSAAEADIVYLYDRLGRLIAVVDPASDTAVYSYDAVGNLLSIARQSSSTVSVIGFDPPTGPVGATVTIQGTGFSATPSQNTVTFNGTAATVTSASANRLVVTVPSGATTGTIGVTAPAGSATSGSAFTVTSSSGSPTITSFTPAVGTSGTSISITGTNFDTTPANNRLKFHLHQAAVSSSTATSLSVPVSVGTTSGRLSLVTPGGAVQSTDDFFVPPWSYAASNVSGTGRISIGGSTGGATITGGDKIALLVFDGTAGQPVSLGVGVGGGVTIADTYIFRPDGTQLAWLYTEFYGGDYHIASLPVTGTYTIMVAPRGSFSGTKGITLSQDLQAGTITVGGSSVTANITRPGQRARLSFSGTAGQQLNLGFSGADSYSSIIVTNPDGSTLTTFNGSSDFSIVVPPLPSTGTYGILIDPTGVETPNVTVTLSEEVGGTLVVDGSTSAVSITRFGQIARLTFSGTSGQRLYLAFTDMSVGPTVSIYKPDGSHLMGAWVWGSPVVMSTGPLPASGTYTVIIDPFQGATGSLTPYLSSEITGTISIGGSSVAVSITRPGQRARLTFSGTASQRVSMGIITSSFPYFGWVSVLRPDESGLAGASPSQGGFMDPATLPTTSTAYAVFVDPGGANTGSTTVTLYDVPADVTGTLTINGSAATANITAPGQNASFTFTGSGQAITVRGNNNTIGCGTFGLWWPNGAQTNQWACGSSLSFSVTAQTGTHSVYFDPGGASTGSIDLSVTNP